MSQAVKDVSASYDALIDLFESIENFLNRFDIYTKIPPTAAMTDIIVKIMVELLSTLALATRQVKQGRLSEFDLANAILDSTQCRKNCKRSFLERTTSNLCCRGLIDSLWTRLGRLQCRPSRLSTLLSNTGGRSSMV